jgi:hypothetical protein
MTIHDRLPVDEMMPQGLPLQKGNRMQMLPNTPPETGSRLLSVAALVEFGH